MTAASRCQGQAVVGSFRMATLSLTLGVRFMVVASNATDHTIRSGPSSPSCRSDAHSCATRRFRSAYPDNVRASVLFNTQG